MCMRLKCKRNCKRSSVFRVVNDAIIRYDLNKRSSEVGHQCVCYFYIHTDRETLGLYGYMIVFV